MSAASLQETPSNRCFLVFSTWCYIYVVIFMPTDQQKNQTLRVMTANPAGNLRVSPVPNFNSSFAGSPQQGYSGGTPSRLLQAVTPNRGTAKNPQKNVRGNLQGSGAQMFPNLYADLMRKGPESSYYPIDPTEFYQPTPEEIARNKARRDYIDQITGAKGSEDAFRTSTFNQALEKLDSQHAPLVPPLDVQSQTPPMDEQGGYHYDWPGQNGWVNPPSFYNQPKPQVVQNAVQKVMNPISRIAVNIASFFKNNS